MARHRRLGWRLLWTLVICALLLSGCWDNSEPKRRAYVLGIGVDRNPDNPEQLRVTVQLPKAGTSKAPGVQDFYLAQGTGMTVVEAAFDGMQNETSRELFWGQCRTWILSSELSTEQFERVIQELRRNSDLDETAYVVIAKGRADDLMRRKTQQEKLPVLYFNNLFESDRRLSVGMPVQAWEFFRTVATPGQHAVAPVAVKMADDRLAVAGMAVFRGYELRGFLDEKDAKDFMLLLGRLQNDQFSLPYGRGRAIIRSLHVGRRVVAHMEGGRPAFDLYLHVNAELGLSVRIPVTEAEIEKLQPLAGQRLQQRLEHTLQRLQQELQSDVLGLGKYLYYRNPTYFDAVQWDEVFPTVPIRVHVDVLLGREGIVR